MASSLSRLVQQLIIYHLLFIVNPISAVDSNYPEIFSLSVITLENNNLNNADFKKVEFEVRGRNFYNGMQIKATKTKAFRNSECREDLTKYNISELWTNTTNARYVLEISKSVDYNIYLCLPQNVNKLNVSQKAFKARWLHQGENVTVQTIKFKFEHKINNDNLILATLLNTEPTNSRNRREEVRIDAPRIIGLRADSSSESEGGIPRLLADHEHKLRLFGEHFSKNMLVAFTTGNGHYGDKCNVLTGEIYRFTPEIIDGKPSTTTGYISVSLPSLPTSGGFRPCVAESTNGRDSGNNMFYHQGLGDWLEVVTYQQLLPLWASIMIIVICLFFSALFSGLNLGLMSLDRTELKILCNTGTPAERKYAKAIQPVRNHGNYLLCSILLGNVFVNSIFTILLDGLTSGVIAVCFATLSIVIFGEITPQAICSRHGLAVGAKTIYITKLVMLVTAPLAYPVSKILDFLLGEEIGNVYNRERLKELLKVTTGENDLDKDEVNIISGALELCKKTVSEVMTRIEDVFMLDYEAILDFETVSDIMKTGYSRIPVFEENRNNIVTMLYIKDLAFVDPDDNTPLKTLCQFYQNPCNFVFEDVTLDIMFRIFKEGNKGHMAFVHRVNSEGEGDPFYETVGLITLEDVIEELIQAEIMDETDVITDNRTKRRRKANRPRQDFSIFADKNIKFRISPQLTLATYQYLSTSIEPFKPHLISERILRRLLKHEDVMFQIKKNKDWKNDLSTVIYQRGKATDYFVLVIEGRVEVIVGEENLIFESGPFTYFGIQALTQNIGIAESPTATDGSLQSLNMDALLRYTFMPDYTVKASTEVFYLKITRHLYLAAKRATLMERSHQLLTATVNGNQFDDDVEKLLHSLEDEGSIGRASPDYTNYTAKTSDHAHMQDLSTGTGVLSHNSTSKTVSPKSSPIQQIVVKDANGSAKVPNFGGGDATYIKDPKNDEEVTLLSKK